MAISLSSGVRKALASLQNSSAQAGTIQNRLATGKKVNSALDNPSSFFKASGLNNRASDLNRLLDDMGQTVKTLEAADKGIKAITKLVESAQSVAQQAKAASDTATRGKLGEQFEGLRTQINQLAKDSSYNGVNLLDGDTLKAVFNEDGSSSLSVVGVDSSAGASGLAITTASSATWGVTADTVIDTAITELGKALTTLRTNASGFGANLSVVQNRVDFTKGLASTLTQGADELTNADTNEEAANLLALQTRTQLSQTALQMASQADQGVLRLF